MVWEIVDNVIDEVFVGFCIEIEIIIEVDNSIIVCDNGCGIFIGINEKIGCLIVEVIFIVLYVGGKFGGGGYKVFGGFYGVGVLVVNVFFIFFEVYVYCEG